MKLLAVETSCDETSAAVLNNGAVLSNVVSSQISHSEFGGVVPEYASREHLRKLTEISGKALLDAGIEIHDLNAVCAATEPGLIGALLTGSNFAKGLSVALGIPFIPVNHIVAHLYSPFIENGKPEFPFLGLIVSGGHTLLVSAESPESRLVLGKTIDDAAGEAYDKVAKLLGLGYPGGRAIDERAKNGDPEFHRFPKAIIKNSEFDFSFSGIKTSVLYFLRKHFVNDPPTEKNINDICASFQEAVTGMLFEKTLKASRKTGIRNIAVSGGVSANSELRKKFMQLETEGIRVFFPPSGYTTDNAAMIGFAALINGLPISSHSIETLRQPSRPRLDYANF